ncbi:MAG: hypothetical protein HY517_00170 [Candidatus Aenigmarchaeota archaeon]|nr:hypothetical protein [Candidatus Aenigmarchaeota archaeon]
MNKRLPLFFLIIALTAMGAIYLPSTSVILIGITLAFLTIMPRDALKNVRILIWIFFILISIALVSFDFNAKGFSVVSIGKNSTLTNIAPGEVIYEVNDLRVTESDFAKSYFGTIKLGTGSGQKFANVNGSLGIEVEKVPSSRLSFGLDIKGGVRAVLESNSTDNATLDQIISTLQTRINIYGLREAVFRPVYHEGKGFVEISIAGGSREELRALLERQGNFEAEITISPRTSGGIGTIRLERSYNFTVLNKSIIVNGQTVGEKQSFELEGVPFLLDTVADRVNMTATVFNSEDIRTVFFDPQRSRVELEPGGYRWSFVIQLSQKGAQKFAWITNNLDVVPGTGYLSSPIVLYLDNNLVDSLSISSSLKGKVETEIQISGSSETREQAIKERAQLQSILRSGALPTSVEIVQLDTISPTLGSSFLLNAALAGFVALIGVIAVVGLRYRRPKIVLPMIIISASEILIILGIASAIGWTIDLPAIAGIIATIGSGINSQIMIIDQALRGEEAAATLKEKLKSAFFVIFGAGGTVIAAMIPLMIIGFGLLRGFAITTIIGVLVGILVVRPAFGEIVKKIVKE